MAEAWDGPSAHLVLDRGARTTLANAVGAAAVANERGAREVVLVTSGWHGRRAGALLDAALAGSGVAAELALTDERGTRRARLREARVLVDRARPEAARESAGERTASASRRC